MKFQGGIRLSEYMNTKNLPITLSDNPPVVTLPLDGGLEPLVDAGTYVKKYEVVAKNNDGFILPSPIAGRVLASEKEYIILENSGKPDSLPPDPEKPGSIDEITFESLIEYTKKYGITGAFSGIPLYKKLVEAYGKGERLIINCIESDPSSGHVRSMTTRYARELILGIKIIMKAMGIKKAVIALDKKHDESCEAVRKHIDEKSGMVIAYLSMKYPLGNERLLLNAIYNTEFSADREVWQAGYPVISAETVINLYESLRDGLPVVYKTLTLSGDALAKPMNIKVPVGTHIGQIFSCLEVNEKVQRIYVVNGLINGFAVGEDTPVSPNTNTAFVIAKTKVKKGSCLKCARCTTICPMHLVPFKFHENHETGEHEENIALGLYNCIECGCCAYICAGKVDLLGDIRAEKYQTLTKEEKEIQTMIFEPVCVQMPDDDYIKSDKQNGKDKIEIEEKAQDSEATPEEETDNTGEGIEQ